MKLSFVLLGVFGGVFLSSIALAQQGRMAHIVCESKYKDRMDLRPKTRRTKEDKILRYYDLYLDEALSSSYIGKIDGENQDSSRMWLTLDRKQSLKHKKDIVSDWDGAAGVTVVLPRGAVLGKIPAGKVFPAKVTVIYNDIAQDSVTNNLKCKIAD